MSLPLIFKYFYVPLLLTVTVVFSSHAYAQTNTDRQYWTIDEYIERQPDQAKRMLGFSKMVQSPAKIISASVKKNISITIVYPANQVSDYWRRSVASMEGRLKEIGIKYTINSYFTLPGTETRAQSSRLGEALRNQPDYLIFTLDVAQHKNFIDRILSNKSPKLILQNITTPLKQWGGQQPFMYVGFDHVNGAKMLADYYRKKTGAKGRYALLYGTKGYVSTMRGDRFISMMQTSPEIELVAAYYTNYNRKRAFNATLEIVQEFPDLKFIYAGSTDISLGIIDALKKTGKLGTVLVNGWGGGSSELEAIVKGDMDVTVMRMNDDNGVAMADAIRLDLEGLNDQRGLIFSGEFSLVEKGINPKTLDGLSRRAFRYSGQ